MSAQLITLPFRPTINLRGGLESGAFLDVFETGTSTPATIYSDAALTVPLSNPLQADSLGVFPDVYYDDGMVVRIRIRQSNGVVLSDTDPYTSGGASAEASADAAAVSAATALAASGPNYADTAAGLAATSEGDTFAVEADGVIVVYSHDAGAVATKLRSFPKDAYPERPVLAVATLAQMSALDPTTDSQVYLYDPLRSGPWVYKQGDFSAQLISDPLRALVNAVATDPDGLAGAFVRQFSDDEVQGSWFGITGDNVDCFQAFAAAMATAAGKTIVLPSGTVRLDAPADDAVLFQTSAANTRFRGQGSDQTTIALNVPSDTTDYHTFVNAIHDDLTFEDLTISLSHANIVPDNGDGTVSEGIVVIDQNANRPTMRNVVIEGNIATQGAPGSLAPTYNVFIFDSSANVDFIGPQTERCTFRNCSRTHLKTNASTGRVSDLLSVDDFFEGFFSNCIGLNGPNGSYVNPQIIRPHFKNHRSGDLARFGFCVALASTEGGLLDAPLFEGQFQIIIHIEEATKNFEIRSPQSKEDMTCLKFIEFVENDISGVTETPDNIIISNPAVRTGPYTQSGNSLGGSDQIAVHVQADVSSATSPLHGLQVNGGFFEGFDWGLWDDTDSSGSSVKVEGTLFDCDTNYYGRTLNTLVRMTHGPNTTTHIDTQRGGLIVGHKFIDAAPNIASSVGGAVGISDCEVVYTEQAAAGSANTNYDILPVDAATRVEGELVASFTMVGIAGYGYEKSQITWDGSTSSSTLGAIFTSGSETQGGSGSSQVAHPNGAGAANRPDAFALSAFNANGSSRSASVSAKFSGLWVKEF